MANMSFFITTEQFIKKMKDITRRELHYSKIHPNEPVGWAKLKPDQHFTAVEKSQGLRKGEHIKFLGQCICISNQTEPLNEIIKRPFRPIEVQEVWLSYRDRICPYKESVHGGYYGCNHHGDNCGGLCLYEECPGASEVAREGFPNLTAKEFVDMFCKHNKKCTPRTPVLRIEFRQW